MMIITRFAPSPTGFLHLGHARCALLAWRRARSGGGRFLLRIEDIDAARCRPHFTDAILEDLAWLGLNWDGVRIQSEHAGDYRSALDRLAARGLLYPCFCTRADIARAGAAPHGEDGPAYPGTCRRLPAAERRGRIAAGVPFALRLDSALAAGLAGELAAALWFTDEHLGRIRCDPCRFGDVVLARKDTPLSYHLCVTHDDALQGVTLVHRGADLLPATDLHRLLQFLLGWPAPVYAHHKLLHGADGRRLAKRDGAATLRQLRDAGASPAKVRAQAGVPD